MTRLHNINSIYLKNELVNTNNSRNTQCKAISNFLALGDSYTVGNFVAERENWPFRIQTKLAELGINVTRPRVIAKNAKTTDELDAVINDELDLSNDWDVVTLLIGVNDQYRGRTIDWYAKSFKANLTRAIAFARNIPSNVIVVSIPDYGFTKFAERRKNPTLVSFEIDTYNTVSKSIAELTNARFVDITTFTKSKDNKLYCDDDLHPSAVMLEGWSEIILPEFIKVLS